MTMRCLETLFSPRSVAVVGASDREGSLGRVVFGQILAGGFEGPVYPVNPRHDTVMGHAAYPDPAALPRTPDLAVVTAPAAAVPGVIDGLGRIGTRTAVVISTGLERDTPLCARMLEAARTHGLRLVGPNCLGLIRPSLRLNASFAHRMPLSGRLAFLSQSGSVVGGVIDWAYTHGIGFSHVVAMGDQADVDIADMLDFLATDTQSRAILLYLEGIENAQTFMSAARAAARVKPVIALKSGRHAQGAQAVSSHSGAMAGSDVLFDAAFERAGILRIRHLEEMFDAAAVLDRALNPSVGVGDRLAVVTNGGGAGVLAVDALSDTPGEGGGRLATLSDETLAGLDTALPAPWSRANPVDIAGDAGPERYGAAMDAVLADPGVDAVLAMYCPTALASGEDAARAVAEAWARHRKGRMRPKPVLANWLGADAARPARGQLEQAGLPSFRTPADAVRGFGYLVRRGRLIERITRVPPSRPDDAAPDWAQARAAIERAVARGTRTLNEAEAKEVLIAAGVPTVRTRRVGVDPAEARAAADALTAEGVRRFALKILSDDLVHKSDAGGVMLDIETAEAVGPAAEWMIAEVRARAPGARLDGLSVQEMLRKPDAHELICGLSDDPVFGPAVLFGRGGTAVEVVNDKALGLPPLDMGLADDLIGATRISKLMDGYRRHPAADRRAVAAVLVRLSEIARALPMITELDINPLLADEHGAIALDARITVARGRMDMPAPNPRFAIHPYPDELVGEIALKDGTTIPCRPVRPEDAPLYERFFERVDPEDLRLRFFSTIRKVPPSMIATLTQIDYARAIAFAALDPDDDAIVGTARLVADADVVKAEYAIQVRSDWKGRGLGRALMGRLIEHGRRVGLSEIWGEVLRENRGMLGLCTALGFEKRMDYEEGIVHVRLPLDGRETRAA